MKKMGMDRSISPSPKPSPVKGEGSPASRSVSVIWEAMPHRIDKRQKPAWKQVRRPLPPPSKPHSTKKGKKGYDRKNKSWKKDTG